MGKKPKGPNHNKPHAGSRRDELGIRGGGPTPAQKEASRRAAGAGRAPGSGQPAPAGTPLLMRDQQRALWAYARVGSLKDAEKKVKDDYKTTVHSFGANILRSGLSAAVADLERRSERGGATLMEHLAAAGIPGLQQANGASIAQRVRGLAADDYMLATREMLAVVSWLKRAVQAIF